MTMRKSTLILLLLSSLAVGGCATLDKVATAVTTTITNPVDNVDLYRVKNVYAASLTVANGYRSYCYAREYAVLMADPVAKPLCRSRRSVVRAMQAADRKAFAAIKTADTFIANNPTLNATSVLGAAWTAVTQFQSLTAQYAAAR